MKKSVIIIIFGFLFASSLKAQEKYSVVLEQAQGMSPYEAIYLLMDYQYWHPEYASIYYHLGNLCYSLIPSRDPLHHYSELNTLLYQSKLFYGNCLHFAKDQKLPGWQYAELADGQKRIEYATLEQFVRPRIEEIKRLQTACDSIHFSFIRMSERYNRCQTLFHQFLDRYTREKSAHLHLLPEERLLLEALRLAADSLDADIATYQTALNLQDIPSYSPRFHKEPIALYRLDGLTYTDFLQNDIAIWDYSKWASIFLHDQDHVYEQLYSDLEKEHQLLAAQISDYSKGKDISGKMDGSLLGRCARLELQTPAVDTIRLMQESVLNAFARQSIEQSPAPKTIREMTPLLQIAAGRRKATPDSAIVSMKQTLVERALPLRTPQPAYIDPMNGETITFETLPGKKPTLREDEQQLVFTKIPGGLWVLITDKDIYWLE